jgi:cytochrome o ubiquinol oxidase subunit IV
MSAQRGAMTSYIVGFGLSLGLTLTAYTLVDNRTTASDNALIAGILMLAVTQLVVQLVFFLHLADETRPRWHLMAFGFMLLVLLIVVFGSLWIMNHLSYHGLTPAETDQQLIEDEVLQKLERRYE